MAIAFVAVIAIGIYYFVWLDDKPALDREKRKETELRAAFEDRQRKAANFDSYRTQLAEIERDFGAMLRQLPGKTEVPNLLVDISQVGVGAPDEQNIVSVSIAGLHRRRKLSFVVAERQIVHFETAETLEIVEI